MAYTYICPKDVREKEYVYINPCHLYWFNEYGEYVKCHFLEDRYCYIRKEDFDKIFEVEKLESEEDIREIKNAMENASIIRR